jgi:hypothetical protein
MVVNKTRSELEESFFVYVKDSNTGKILRTAFPSDVQIGTAGNPKELQLLGALSLATKDFVISERSNVSYLSDHDTILNLKYSSTPTPALVTIYLPPEPRDGQIHCIKDADGISSIIEIDIRSSVPGTLIDADVGYTLLDNYDSVILYWRDTKWQVLAKANPSGGGGGGGAPTNANYVTLSTNTTLTNERVLSVSGSNLSLTDNGPNNTVQINLTSILGGGAGTYTYSTVTADAFGRITAISSGTPPPGSTATYLTLSTDAGLSNERVLSVSSSNISLTDNGPNSTAQLDLTSILGGGAGTFANSTVTADAFGRITAISAGATPAPVGASYIVISNDATLTTERALAVGLGLLLTDAGANSTITLAISDSVIATLSGSTFSGPVIAGGGLTGSLQQTTDGLSYLVAGPNITIESQSNGQILISSTATGSFSGDSGADVSASYIVVGNTGSLPNERALTAGYGLELLDGGAGGNLVISFLGSLSASGGGSGADVSASYITLGNTGSLPNERALVAGYGISLVDGGPGENVVISFAGSLSSSGGSTTCTSNIAVTASYYEDIHDFSLINTISSSGVIQNSTYDGTLGVSFRCLKNREIVGIKTYTSFSYERTILANIWDHTSSSVAATIATIPAGVGTKYISFGTASWVVPESNLNKQVQVSIRYTDATDYTRALSAYTVRGNNPFLYAPDVIIDSARRYAPGNAVPSIEATTDWYLIEPVFKKVDVILTSSISACAPAFLGSAYSGYTTGAINLNQTASWTPILSGTQGHFQDLISRTISRNNSTFTINESGSYNFHASFNTYGSDAYITLRLSGSNGTTLQRSTYRSTPIDQNPATLDGIFDAQPGSIWSLEYIASGSVFPWTSSNPLPGGENMWTGEVSMYRVQSDASASISTTNDIRYFSSGPIIFELSKINIVSGSVTSGSLPAATSGSYLWIKKQNISSSFCVYAPSLSTVDNQQFVALHRYNDSVKLFHDGSKWNTLGLNSQSPPLFSGSQLIGWWDHRAGVKTNATNNVESWDAVFSQRYPAGITLSIPAQTSSTITRLQSGLYFPGNTSACLTGTVGSFQGATLAARYTFDADAGTSTSRFIAYLTGQKATFYWNATGTTSLVSLNRINTQEFPTFYVIDSAGVGTTDANFSAGSQGNNGSRKNIEVGSVTNAGVLQHSWWRRWAHVEETKTTALTAVTGSSDGQLVIGSRGRTDTPQQFKGKISHVIVYDSAIFDDDLEAITKFLLEIEN